MKTRFFWFTYLVSLLAVISIYLILYFQYKIPITILDIFQIILPILLISLVLTIIFSQVMWVPVDRFMEKFPEYTDIEKDSMVRVLQRIYKRYENTLAEKQARLSILMDLLNNLDEGVLIIDQEEKVFFHNYSSASILHFSIQTSEKHLWEIIRSTELMDQIRKTIHGKQTFQGEIQLISPMEVSIRYKIIPLKDQSDKMGWKTLIFIQDATNIRRLEKVRSDFVANVSHELKSPLTAILGYSELLTGTDENDPLKLKRYSLTIHDNVLRLIEIVDDLLLLSKIETGEFLQKTTFSIQDLFNELEELYKQKLVQKKIQWLTSLENSSMTLYADKFRIRQMLINLVDNAIKFSHEEGSIHLRAKKEKKGILLTIQDNGIGIPFIDQERIFERFYQVDKARSSHSEGTGLGLSIVKHIVEQHQGNVSVESHLGKGSIFSIYLPQSIEET